MVLVNAIARGLSFFAISLALSAPAFAQSYPNKPVKLVIPYPPGSPSDILARAMGEKLGEQWKQPVIVENRPGANEIVGGQAVAKAPPDGYTILLASDATFSMNSLLYPKMPYDPIKELAPIGRLFFGPAVIAGRPDLPPNTTRELIEYMRTHKGTYGSNGSGGTAHLTVAWFTTLYGINGFTHVPYTGMPQALQDVMASRVDLIAAFPLAVAPYLKAGKLKVYGVAADARVPMTPDVPTFAEQGFKEFEAGAYFALAAPSGTPAAILDKIAFDASGVMGSPEFRAKSIDPFGFNVVRETPAQFREFLKQDRESNARRIKAANIKIE